MADYTVRIVAETDDADKKVKRLDERLKSVSNDKKIHIELPGIEESISNIKALGSALATTYKVARNIPVIGGKIQDVEDLGDITLNAAKKVAQAGKLIASATPGNIISGSVSGSISAVNQLAKSTAEVGYTIFGITQSVGVLKAAFGGFFDDTIGREIRLQEALLRTKTTLASTADVAVNGKRITDPYQAILKLEGPINDTLDSIRVRSLEIAGTTSDAIVQVFGVVASQIGNIGGSLKDAEDLAITFSAALGTLGLSDPMYATQEIRSILTGTIDQNSVLARSLGLTNEEVTKAKSSAEGLVAFLQKRLAAFTAGQSLAAKGFAGITSNIQEFGEELKRAFGKGFLAPLLDGLTVLYQRLQLIFKPALGIADALGKTGGAIARGFVGAAAAAPSIQGVSGRKALSATEGGEKYAISAFLQIQTAVDKLRPQIASLVDQAVKGLAQLSGGFAKLLEGFANFKFEQFKIYLDALTSLGEVLNATVIPAFNALMRVYGEILKNPIGQWFTQLTTTMGLLERVGVLPLARTLFVLTKVVPGVIETFKQLSEAFNWIKVKLAGLVDFIVTGFAMAISAGSTAIVQLGETFINVAQVGVNKFLLALQSVVGALGVFLVELGTTIQQMYPKFGQLGVGIASVGKAIIGVIPAIEKARIGYAEFALSAIESLSKLQVKTEQVKQGVVSLGERIKGAIGGAAGSFVKSLKDMAVGLIVFQAQMFLLQAAIGVVTKVISDWQRKQQEISDQTRAELAVKRLSTVYAEVSENATAATKAAREFELQILNTRVDSLKTKLEQLSNALDKITDVQRAKGVQSLWRSIAAIMNTDNFDVKPKMINKHQQETYIQAIIRTRKEELAKASQELEALSRAQEKIRQNQKATEDVQILAKERAQLEKEIKDLRKQYSKEISDFEWSEKQKVLQLEQQMREATRQAERNDMQRRFAAENQNLGNISKGFRTILNEYQLGVFDAQVESEKRQFELATKREELEKQVADYTYRLEEQRTKLREKIGNYEQKLEDYKTEQAKRRSREVLQNALEVKGVMSDMNKILLTPQDKEEFLNRSAQRGVSAERTLAFAMGALTEEQKAMSPAALVDQLVDQFGAVLRAPEAEFRQKLGLRANFGGQSLMPNYIMGISSATLGTGQFKTTAPPTPPKTNAIDTFVKDTDAYIARMRAGLEKTFELSKAAADQAGQLATAENWNKFVASLRELGRWGISTSAGQVSEEIDSITSSITLMERALQKGTLPSRLDSARTSFEQFFESGYKNFTDSTLAGKGDKDKAQYQLFFTQLSEVMKHAFSSGDFSTARETTGQMMQRPDLKTVGAFINAAIEIFAQMKEIVRKEGERALVQLRQEMVELRAATLDLKAPLLERLSQLGELAASMLPGGNSLGKANSLSNFRALQETQERILSIPRAERTPERVNELVIEGQKLAESYRKQNAQLDPLNRALEDLAMRTINASRAADILMGAYRTLAENFLDGSTSLRDSIKEFSSSIAKGFIQQFLDYAMAPMKDLITQQMAKIFKVPDAQQRAMNEFNKAASGLSNAAQQQVSASQRISSAASQVSDAASKLQLAASAIANPGGGPQGLQVIPYQDATTGSDQPSNAASAVLKTASTNATTALSGVGQAVEGLADTSKKAADDSDTAAKKGSENFTKFLGGMMSLATGALSIAGGIQQLQEGGTSNTLAGIGSILLGIGGAIGGLGSMGLFGKKAGGGAVSANRPYLVGEAGPEVVVPGTSGTVMSNSQLREAMSSRAAGTSTPQLNMTFQTTSIGGVEYVSREQLEAAMASTRRAAVRDGARQGMSMTIDKLRQSPGTRSRVGLR